MHGMAACGTSNLDHTPNFVQMRAIATKLWPINRIYNGGRRHLEFTSCVDFGHVAYFR